METTSDYEEARKLAADLPRPVQMAMMLTLVQQVKFPIQALALLSPCDCGDAKCISAGVRDAAARFVATLKDLVASTAPETVSLDTVMSKIGEAREKPLTVEAPSHVLGCDCETCLALNGTST